MNTSWDGKLGLRDLEALLIRGFCGKFCSARCARTHIWSMDTFDMYIMCVLCIQPRQQASLSNHISVLRICSWLLSSRMLRLSHHGGQESPQLVLLRRWIGSSPYALSFFFLKLFANNNKKQSRSGMIASKQRWFCTIILFLLSEHKCRASWNLDWLWMRFLNWYETMLMIYVSIIDESWFMCCKTDSQQTSKRNLQVGQSYWCLWSGINTFHLVWRSTFDWRYHQR